MSAAARPGRSWRDAGVLLAVAAAAAWVIRGGSRSRPAGPPSRAGKPRPVPGPAPVRPLPVIALVVSVWVVLSPFLLVYPFGDAGQDLLLATDMVGLLCAVCAVPRLRSRPGAWPGAIPLLVASLVLGAVPYLRGAGPSGELALPWWNLTLSAAALVALTVTDVARRRVRPEVGRARRSPQPPGVEVEGD